MLDNVKTRRCGTSSYLIGGGAPTCSFWRAAAALVPLALGLVTLGCGGAQPDFARPMSAPVDTAEARAGAETGAARRGEDDVSPIVGIEWHWVRFVDPIAGGIDVPEPHRYTMLLGTDGVAHVQADCNEGSGSYMLDRNELAVRILETTDEDCGEGSLSAEFIDNVNSAALFHSVDGRLVLSLRWETGMMEFVAGSPQPSPGESPQEQSPDGR